uniref:Putative hhh secreted protein n=1 Tax=Psorophora albipes TaxID=869069 RepID=T1E3E3_9DIPT
MKLLLVTFVATIAILSTTVVAFPNHRNGTSDLPNPSGQWNGTDNTADQFNRTITDARGPFHPSSWRNNSEPIQPRPFRYPPPIYTFVEYVN